MAYIVFDKWNENRYAVWISWKYVRYVRWPVKKFPWPDLRMIMEKNCKYGECKKTRHV